MKKLITANEMKSILAAQGTCGVPSDAQLTPIARDMLKDAQRKGGAAPKGAKILKTAEPVVPDYEYKWAPGSDPQTPAELQAFYHSRKITTLRERMADIGQRIWNKDYVDGNGGNLTIRVGDNLVLCTPTLISKGFMSAEDMCLVDMNGTQLAGTRKRTSEVMTHIGIMKRQPKAKACCHAHPPHATAFAVASVVPPTCMIPEAEVFLGQIGMAPYQTPGSPENADTVGEIGVNHQSVLMENHGVITWGKDIEDAYWKMENTDAYCKTVWIASQLKGGKLKTISGSQAKELIGLRKSLGMDDYRDTWKECELCDNSDFRPGVVCGVPSPASASSTGNQPEYSEDAEALVQQITNEVMKAL
ncbi:MAG: class II aldolase/adducin family protein [Kiritimatiellae bacterium]|jgi:L-fuculose-phosphate aldolase|nr:class II aldolase/adducin family protein [Kiritimatiellia bacterium]